MEEILRNGIQRSPSARQPAPIPQEQLLPRRNTPSILEQMTLAPTLNMSAQRVTINSPIVTTTPAALVCYVCRLQGHTASRCFFAAIDQVMLRPVFCGPAEQARRRLWLQSGNHGPYPFSTSPPFARLPEPSAETESQTPISFAGFSEVPTWALAPEYVDSDETLDGEGQEAVVKDEERSASVTEVGQAPVLRQEVERRSPSEVRQVNRLAPTWQQQEERGKELQRQGQALLVEARNLKKKADLEKEVQKDEKAAEEARERAEKSRKRLREMK